MTIQDIRVPYIDATGTEQRLTLRCQIDPPRRAPRVGADHPKFMDPGSPGRLRIQSVLWEGIDVTERFGALETERLEAAARRHLGFPEPATAEQRRLV